MSAAIPVTRGCGKRKAGGCYAECGIGGSGKPIEYFLCDPPVLIDKWRVSSVGVQMIEIEGVHHLLDVVGQQHYPNVADFIEETRRFGVSRRLPGVDERGKCLLDYSKLDARSRLLLAHRRAWIDNLEQYPAWGCPKGLAGHDRSVLLHEPEEKKRMCAGAFWQDLDPAGTTPIEGSNLVTRTMPSFTYDATLRPENVEPKYRLAIFARFPISRLVTIGGSEKSATNFAEIQKSNLTTAMERE